MSKAKILIVDDEKNIRLTTSQTFTLEEYEVETASNGKEALQKLEQQPFDVMLLDLKMPEMGGLEVLKQAHHLYPKLKVIIVSAHATLEEAVEAMKLGAVDYVQKPIGYLPKPYTPKLLRHAVENLLHSE